MTGVGGGVVFVRGVGGFGMMLFLDGVFEIEGVLVERGVLGIVDKVVRGVEGSVGTVGPVLGVSERLRVEDSLEVEED